ncbi:hypothetical protein G7Y89_g2788 [Cudoniella acicularis]|uniref:Uncharacterized protein n=1 Tax=Cudoniella acicularis TaxID=354080 RepID=A0A8H4RVN7_9HELO|nr:hypothetical protein G7Y89_g2788 [Cudoniella acicularis]
MFKVHARTPRTRTRTTSRRQTDASTGIPASLTPNRSLGPPPSTPSERVSRTAGFFGSTSFSSTLHQAADGLKETQDDIDDDPHIDMTKLHMGIKALRVLPTKATCYKLVEHYITNSSEVGFPRPVMQDILDGIWAKYAPNLEEPRESHHLEEISKDLNKNTQIPLNQAGGSDKWKSSFTASNTRWESLGMVFAALAFGIASLNERDTLLTGESNMRKDRKKYMSEMKEAVFGVAPKLRCSSKFTGRPPALSRRYHSCPLPYDVSDEALMAGGVALQQELARLDEHGWNTEGLIQNSTISRMMVHAAIIQDEIMELFIGNQDQWSIERVNALKIKTVELYSHVPVILAVTKDILVECESEYLTWRLFLGRLDYVRIHFLLERLSTERGGESNHKLLEVAKEIVDLIVSMWVHRDRSVNRHYDYDYIIMCYGMPSTGILCTELLKQIQHPDQVDPTSKLSCSEVVQNLSLMIGFLEWVRPSAGNYKLCRRMAKAIKKVLDQVFEPPPQVQSEQENADPNLMHLEDAWQTDPLGDWDWLNSIDWSRGPHMDWVQ